MRKFGGFEIKKDKVLIETAHFFSFVTPNNKIQGASLIIPVLKHDSPLSFTADEWQDFGFNLLETTQKLSDKYESILGFNIGWNIGEKAGQTVSHCHCHILPRLSVHQDKPEKGIRFSIERLLCEKE